MKTQKELAEIAKKAFFAKNPNLPYMFATQDGNFFYPDFYNAANSHASVCGGQVMIIGRDGEDLKETPEITGTGENHKTQPQGEYVDNAKNTIAAIKKSANPAELTKVETHFKLSEDKRQTVIDAWNKRKGELSAVSGAGAPTGGGDDPLPADALLKLLAEVKTEKDLDDLEANHNLSKHENEEIVKAYETKENEFLS